jgi:ParB/RepB/Spo0J family partition protein
MPNKIETIEHIPLTAITADASWNARSGRWSNDLDYETGDGFEGLKASIAACGVKEPAKIRPIEAGERPYALVSGFRRYAASLQLNLQTIPAVVREMSEAEARLENTRENAVRQELKTPDLAWAIAQMVAQGMTDTEIARGIGRSQAYVSQLHRIMTDLEAKVTSFWRACPIAVPVDAMYVLTKVPRDDQWQAFQTVLRRRDDDEGRVWKRERLQALARRARAFGVTLGKLARMKYVDKVSADFEDMVENVIKIPGSATARHRRALAEAMAKGYAEGVENGGRR